MRLLRIGDRLLVLENIAAVDAGMIEGTLTIYLVGGQTIGFTGTEAAAVRDYLNAHAVQVG